MSRSSPVLDTQFRSVRVRCDHETQRPLPAALLAHQRGKGVHQSNLVLERVEPPHRAANPESLARVLVPRPVAGQGATGAIATSIHAVVDLTNTLRRHADVVVQPALDIAGHRDIPLDHGSARAPYAPRVRIVAHRIGRVPAVLAVQPPAHARGPGYPLQIDRTQVARMHDIGTE